MNEWMKQTFRKNEVRSMTPLGPAPDLAKPDTAEPDVPKPDVAKPDAVTIVAPAVPRDRTEYRTRRPVSDSEVREILGSEEFDLDDVIASGPDPLVAVPADEASVQQMLRIAGGEPNAKRYETDHFVLVHTSTADKTRSLASRLEAVYHHVARWHEMLGIPVHPPENKLEVFFFGTHEEYLDYQGIQGFRMMQALGFYMRTNNRSAFFDMYDYAPFAAQREQLKNADFQTRRRINNEIKNRTDKFNLEVIQHEAAHHIHFNVGTFPRRGDLNSWVVEGLAQMFEVPPGEGGGSLGATNHGRLSEFRQIYRDPERFDLRLFIVDNRLWQGGASYSMGWSLHQYLWAKHRDAYAKFMRLMSEREDDVTVSETQWQQEFEEFFGAIDEEWVKKWAEYMNGLQLRRSLGR
jgi:hypothetical protein